MMPVHLMQTAAQALRPGDPQGTAQRAAKACKSSIQTWPTRHGLGYIRWDITTARLAQPCSCACPSTVQQQYLDAVLAQMIDCTVFGIHVLHTSIRLRHYYALPMKCQGCTAFDWVETISRHMRATSRHGSLCSSTLKWLNADT